MGVCRKKKEVTMIEESITHKVDERGIRLIYERQIIPNGSLNGARGDIKIKWLVKNKR